MEKKHIITIAGKPGSGKSTTANLIAERLEYRRFSSGDLMRTLAKERGLTLAELQTHTTGENTIDDIVDSRLREIGTTEDNLVIDSRLAFHWIPTSFKVYLDLDLSLAAKRIYTNQSEERTKRGEIVDTFENFHESLTTRFKWEQDQYEALYGVNPNDPNHFDLVVDTSNNNPERVAETILEHYHIWLGE